MTQPCVLKQLFPRNEHVAGKGNRDGDVKPFDDASWKRVMEIDTFRRQCSQTSKFFAIKIPEVNDGTIGYHSVCYKNFTAISIPVVKSEDVHIQSKPTHM